MKAKIQGAKGTVHTIDGVDYKGGETVEVTPELLRRLGENAVVVEDGEKGGKA